MKTRYIIPLAAGALILAGCQRELLPEGDVNFGDGQIRYSINNVGVKSSADDVPGTGSLSLVSGDGKLTVPVTCEVSEGIDLGSGSAETKGALINTSGSDSDLPAGLGFTVSAYKGSTPQFENKTATKSGDYWTMDPPQYWPLSTKLTFYAYANTGSNSVVQTATSQTLSYTVTGDAASHMDLMLGYYKGNGGNKGIAEMRFDHPLTAVRFKKGEMTGVTGIKSITISGLAKSGTVVMDADGVIGNWTVAGTEEYKTEVTLSGGETALGVEESSNLIGKDSEGKYNGAFLLIPQTLSEHDVTVTVVLSTESGDDVTVYADITSGTWQAGMTNTYTLGYMPAPKVNWIDLGIKADNGNTLLWCDRNVVAIDASGVATLAGDIYSYNSVENAGLFDYSTAMTITSVTSSLPEGITGHLRLPTKDEGAALKNSTSSRSWGDESGLVHLSITGSTGEKIVFPASGFIPAKGVFGGQGDKVRVWTSTPNDGGKGAYRFYSDKGGSTGCNADNALDKYNVRLVFEVEKPELLTGKFSVSDTEYVQFSKGNLFCTDKGSGNYEFSFEEKQYDYRCRYGLTGDKAVLGGTVTTTPQYTSGLFQWIPRTSSSAAADWGAFTSNNVDPDDTFNDVLDFGGVFPGSDWTTLTGDQWKYLLDHHTNKFVTVIGVNGLAIAPDDYEGEISASYTTLEQWAAAEADGIVFLPIYACYIAQTGKLETSELGYWSSSPNTVNKNYATALHFYSYGANFNVNERWRIYGQNVRLVQKFFKPHDAVYIGGKYWATMNVGATTVAGSPSTCYGDYYAWGETEPYYSEMTIDDASSTATFTWKGGKTGYNWTSYCGSDSFKEWDPAPYNPTTKVLNSAYDAATKKWSSPWRMPKSEEFKSLYDACGGTEEPQDISTATVKNGKVTSKGIYWCGAAQTTLTAIKVPGLMYSDGNGNNLFFPAAGYVGNTTFGGGGTGGYYWSSSLNTGLLGDAFNLGFYNNQVFYPSNNYSRFYGFPIRPVHD